MYKTISNTDAYKSLTTLVVKHYNDLQGKQNSEWGRHTLALCMPIFKKKIFAEIPWKKFQTYHCSNVTKMENLELFPRNLR